MRFEKRKDDSRLTRIMQTSRKKCSRNICCLPILSGLRPFCTGAHKECERVDPSNREILWGEEGEGGGKRIEG